VKSAGALRLVAGLAGEALGIGRMAVRVLDSMNVESGDAKCKRAPRAERDIADRSRELKALARGGLCFFDRVRLGEAERACCECGRPQGSRHVVARQRKRGPTPARTLAAQLPTFPVLPERSREPQRGYRFLPVERPGERRAQVVELAVELGDQRRRIGALELGRRALGERDVEVAMAAASFVATRVEPLACEVGDGLERPRRVCPSGSERRTTRFFATSASSTSSEAPVTACAASSVQPPAKIAGPASAARSWGVSSA